MDRSVLAILTVWLCGFAVVMLMRVRVWLRLHTIADRSTTIELALPIPARSYPGLMEPGVFGIWHPVLLLPSDVQSRLTPQQFEAVVAHELCHVQRRDNLTSAIHMIVEAVFWFHPLVWWIGSRLVIEREQACDEEVLRLGNEPQVYAEGILNVCKTYLESPLRCMSGVTGSDLKRRIHTIATGRVAANLSIARKATLGAAAVTALALPLVAGMIVHASSLRAQAPVETPDQFAARNSLNQGVKAFRENRFDDAIDFFKKAIELDPNFSSAELYLATAYAQQVVSGGNSPNNQKYADMAIQAFQKVLQKNPTGRDSIIAAEGIAGMYYATGRFDKAREAYLKNVELDPKNPDPFYKVGSMDWMIVHNTAATLSEDDRSRLIEEGLQHLERALSLRPNFEDAIWHTNLLMREKSGILKAKAQASTDANEKAALLASAAEWEARAFDWTERGRKIHGINQAANATGGAASPNN